MKVRRGNSRRSAGVSPAVAGASRSRTEQALTSEQKRQIETEGEVHGSGSSYHDLSAFVATRPDKDPQRESAQFDSWLKETLVDSMPKERSERLLKWDSAPFARAAHPQEDHFVPLHVAVGAAEGEPGEVIYRQEDFFGKLTISSYRFGNMPSPAHG